MQWQVYILFSATLNRYYTGCSSQFDIRLEQHQLHYFGMDSFTAKANDWELQLLLTCRDEHHAKAIERHIKQMKSKVYISNLILYSELQHKLLTRY
jgi:putative endonuclease